MVPRKNNQRNTKSPAPSAEERTPRKLKAQETDLTVVVGDIEFYHYKIILCSGSDFFDTMLSTQMRENDENRIEFPDKNPDEWLEVYSFIDQTYGESPTINIGNALKLISWFDFFAMDELAEKCDKVHSESLPEYIDFFVAFGELWDTCKAKPCPKTQEKVLNYIKNSLDFSSMSAREAKALKEFILDEVGGERLWQALKGSGCLHFPPEVKDLDRTELANNVLFEYFLRTSPFCADLGLD